MFSRKEQWWIFGTVNAVAVLTIILFPFYRQIASSIPNSDCNMVEYMHIYCPACGGTRAFAYLLEFDILASLWHNPIVVFGLVVFVLYEIMMIKYLIRGGDRPTFLKTWFVIAVLSAWIVFGIVRNVLLFNGFDMLGDIIV